MASDMQASTQPRLLALAKMQARRFNLGTGYLTTRGLNALIGQFALLAMLALCVSPAWGEAAGPIEARVGNHPGFGRLVFDFAGPMPYQQALSGDHLLLHLATNVIVMA